MFKPVGGMIGVRGRFGKSGDAVAAIQVRQVATKVINDELADLPKEVLGLIVVKTYKNGVLTIACPPMVSAELYMRSSGLIKGINGVLGKELVYEIRFRAG